jgi:hypothetical protein
MSLSTVEYDAYYQYGLPDDEALARHWTGERYIKDLAALGVSNPSLSDLDVAQIRGPYLQESRGLHIDDHGVETGNVQRNRALDERLAGTPFADWRRVVAVARIAGDCHDVGYKHIDADPFGRNAWPPQIVHLINGIAEWSVDVVNGERLFTTSLTEKGRSEEESLTQIVASLFEFPEDGALSHKGGSNELDSALVAKQFLQKHGIDGKEQPLEALDVIAIAAIVAATIPFRPNASVDEHGNIVEGVMEKLGRRVHAALLKIGEDPKTAYRTANAIMAIGVCVANRDTWAFMRPNNASNLINGARQLKAEEALVDGRYVLREEATTMSGLLRAARIMYSAPGLYQKIISGETPSAQVPTFVVPFDDEGNLQGLEYSYPPQEAHTQAVGYVEENVDIAGSFFPLHEVGIAIGRSFLRLARELDSEVPGAVNSKVWLSGMAPVGENFADLMAQGGKGLMLYQELAGRALPVRRLATRKSPLSALALGGAGLTQAMELSGLIQTHWVQAEAAREPDPYFNRQRAEELNAALLLRVGPQNYNKILDVLILAADLKNNPGRLEELEKLRQRAD